MWTAVVLLLLPVAVLCDVDCSKRGDGTYELGCKAFVVCHNGVATQHECQLKMVYNNVTKKCDYENHVLPPCGLIRDCSHLADGRYADKELNCKSYFTCSRHVYFGHNLCTPVLPPCGLIRDCSHLADGRYADIELNCKSYFTCSRHVYFGHNLCTPGTVFSDALGTCAWPRDVDPPCGTRQASTTPVVG